MKTDPALAINEEMMDKLQPLCPFALSRGFLLGDPMFLVQSREFSRVSLRSGRHSLLNLQPSPATWEARTGPGAEWVRRENRLVLLLPSTRLMASSR